MDAIYLEVSKDDKDLINILKHTYKEYVDDSDFLEVKSFDGMDFVVIVAIPLLPLTYQILQDHFINPNPNVDSKIKRKRKIIITRKRISIIGYTGEELSKILPQLSKNECNE